MDEILNFAALVKARLSERRMSASDAEKAGRLKPDTIRNVLRANSDKGPQLETARDIADALGLELYIGPPRAVAGNEVTDSEFAKIRRYDVEAAAGAGTANGDHPASSDLAFRRDWLSRLGLNPNSACAITIKGDSMEPTISDGDLALIDTRVDFPIPGEIYAVCLANGDLVVKRMGDAKEAAFLTSDNRDHGVIMIDKGDLPATRFVGRVVWTGRAVGGKGISTADQAALKKRWKELLGE